MAAVVAEMAMETKGMMERIAHSSATVCSQQRGEPDLTIEQRVEHLAAIYHKSPSAFLSRFGVYMAEEDLRLFDEENFEENFYLKDIRKRLDPHRMHKVVRNRRHECMRRLMEEGEYFSERTMSLRNPLLFEHYVGQYMSEEERRAMELEEEQGQCALSAMIMFQMQQDRRSRLLARQREKEHEEEIVHGVEDIALPADSHVCRDKDVFKAEEISAQPWGEVVEEKPAEKHISNALAAEERAFLRQEFLSLMQQSFLDGKDKGFDYSAVDNNADYDNLDTRRQDEEETYFESEDPEDCLADEDDLAWLRSRATKQATQRAQDFEEEFDEDESEDEEMDGS